MANKYTRRLVYFRCGHRLNANGALISTFLLFPTRISFHLLFALKLKCLDQIARGAKESGGFRFNK